MVQNIIVYVIIAVAVFFAVRYFVRRFRGRGGCGCGGDEGTCNCDGSACASCPMHYSCTSRHHKTK